MQIFKKKKSDPPQEIRLLIFELSIIHTFHISALQDLLEPYS